MPYLLTKPLQIELGFVQLLPNLLVIVGENQDILAAHTMESSRGSIAIP